jgi:hypothetical protein
MSSELKSGITHPGDIFRGRSETCPYKILYPEYLCVRKGPYKYFTHSVLLTDDCFDSIASHDEQRLHLETFIIRA